MAGGETPTPRNGKGDLWRYFFAYWPPGVSALSVSIMLSCDAFSTSAKSMYVTPRDFCYAFKDWDGNPTDFGVQKDVDEFLKQRFHGVTTMEVEVFHGSHGGGAAGGSANRMCVP